MAGKDSYLFLFLFFTFFLLNLLSLGQTIYRDEDSSKTLLLRTKRNENKSCAQYKEYLFTQSEINDLLKLHSKVREDLVKRYDENLPKAFYLKNLSWSEKLAEMAQKLAVQCTSVKDLEYENQPVGQLIITSDAETGKNLSNLIDKWTAGLKHVTPEIIAKYKKPNPGEFDYEPATQIIWWNTTALGCGRSNFTSTNCSNNNNSEHCTEQTTVKLVCCYFPAGNREGDPVYVTEKDNLICRYDDKHVHCKKITTKTDEKKPTKSRKGKDSIGNRIRNRMIELWPAAGTATSLKAKWNIHWFSVLFYVTLMFFNVIFNKNKL